MPTFVPTVSGRTPLDAATLATEEVPTANDDCPVVSVEKEAGESVVEVAISVLSH
jgi:hypothetical protein